MKSKYKKLFNNTIVFAIGNFGSKILTFLLVPLYTSFLSTEQYGTADLVTTTVSLLQPILTLSIYEAILRFSLDKEKKPDVVLSNALLITLIGIVVLLCLSPIGLYVDWHLSEYWWYIVGIFIMLSFQICFSSYLKGVEKTKLFALQGLVYTIVYLLSNVFLIAFFDFGIEGYLLSVIFGYFASIVFMLIFGKIPICLNKYDNALIFEMLKYSIPLAPAAVLWWFNAYSDKYMLLWLIGAGANGLYTVANKIPSIFTTFSSLFSQAWRLSAISNFDDEQGKTDFYSRVYIFYFLFCVYICFILVALSKVFASILFKNDYYSAWILIPMLLFASLMGGLSGFLESIYAAAKKTKQLLISMFIGSLFNIVLNYFLIKEIGIIGAPIATAISFIVIWIIRSIVLKKIISMKIDYYRICLSLAMTFFAFLLFSYDFDFKYILLLVTVLIITIINYKDVRLLLIESIKLFKKEKRKK